jgi:hypothetical protein
MLYKLINNPYELQTEFKKYDRDYYTITEYQAILDYFETNDLIRLDVISICCDIIKMSWEELYQEWGDPTHENIIEALSHTTNVLTWDDNSVLYISY